MSDSSTSSLRELRELAAKAGGTHEERLLALEDELRTTKARLQRRTNDVRTLASVVRAIALHVGLPLTEVSDGDDGVSAPVPEPEPG